MSAVELIERFNAAWLRGDLPEVLAYLNDDIVYSTSGRDGKAVTYRGLEAVSAIFAEYVGDDPDLRLGPVAAGDGRAVCEWSYPTADDGTTLRGLDLYTIVDGRISAKDVFAKLA